MAAVPHRRRGRFLALPLLVLVAGIGAPGCVGGNVVIGHISPSTFQFTTVIERDGPGPGGWQVAQVAALLGRLAFAFPRAAICEVEVGVPLANRQQGAISKSRAQDASARAADRAAHELLGERARPTADACVAFRTRMRKLLRTAISGATVSAFRPWPGTIPRRTFPPRRGR